MKKFLLITVSLLFTLPLIISFKGKEISIKYIYLTFDDGPLEGSERIDSVVLVERLKVNVFLVGQNIKEDKRLKNYYDLYEENPFIESYNHSFSHAHNKYKAFYRDPADVLTDIQKNEQVLQLKYKIVRLPGRNIWRLGQRSRNDGTSGQGAANLLANNGFKLFGWDLEWEHNASDGVPIQTVEEMTREIENKLESGSTFMKDHIVILIHDEMFRKKWEESELNQLIDNLRKHENYVFEHVRFYPVTQ